MIQTTLAAAATALQTEIYVPSVSGVVAGNILFTEREGMKVLSVNAANNFVSVQRGYQSGVTAHPLGATVYIGSAASFGSVDPSGSVIAGSVTPFINLQDGKVWDGSSGTWTLSADPGNGAVPVAVLSKTVTLTDAQIKALPTTEIEIVPGPGAGKVIFPFHALIVKNFLGGEYTNIDANGYMYVDGFDMANVPNDTTPPGIQLLDSFLGANSQLWWLFPAILPVAQLQTDWGSLLQRTALPGSENNTLLLAVSNGSTGNLTGGDPANTLKVTILYTIVDVS